MVLGITRRFSLIHPLNMKTKEVLKKGKPIKLKDIWKKRDNRIRKQTAQAIFEELEYLFEVQCVDDLDAMCFSGFNYEKLKKKWGVEG